MDESCPTFTWRRPSRIVGQGVVNLNVRHDALYVGRASFKKELQLIHTAATHSHSCNSNAQLHPIDTAHMGHDAFICESCLIQQICYPFILLQLTHTAATHSHNCKSFTQLQLSPTAHAGHDTLILWVVSDSKRFATHSYRCNSFTQLQHLHSCNSFTQLQLALYSHITRTNESCHIYEWVMSHIHERVKSRMLESCHTYEWVMSHIWMSHVTYMNDSCHIYEWDLSHTWIGQGTWRGGGLGSRPKKMYGERLGDGVEYHSMKPTPRR